MSFGFGVGDFLAVGTLCWKLYQNVYKVSRDAPKELQGICDELGTLSNTIRLLNDDIQDPHSVIKQPGQENRFNLAADIMKNTNNTLEQLQNLADKHDFLLPQGTGKSKRQYLRIKWDKLKFAKEWNAITDLRTKLLYHNNQLSLLLQVLNNSSLERLQKEEKRTQKLIEDVHMVIYGAPNTSSKTTTAPFLNTKSVEELTEAFLVSAQSGTRPWSTIGVDSWLQAGRWWLIKAQSSLYTAHPGSPAYTQAFVDLLKSSWILTNIISMHPQRKDIVSTDPRDRVIEGLAQALKSEHDKLANLSLPEPSLEQLRSADLNIWSSQKYTSLVPVREYDTNLSGSTWKTQNGEILLQSFAHKITPGSTTETECILILEVQSQKRSVTFIAQSIDGQDIMSVPLYFDTMSMEVEDELDELPVITHYVIEGSSDKDPIMVIRCRHLQYGGVRDRSNVDATFRLMNMESRNLFSAFSSGAQMLLRYFGSPPINIPSLEAAALLSYSSMGLSPPRLLGTLNESTVEEIDTPTKHLCTLAIRAMSCHKDESWKESKNRPLDASFHSLLNPWSFFVQLSPTAELVISLAETTNSRHISMDLPLQFIHAAFAKKCAVFFNNILEYFGIQLQGRFELVRDDNINPEGLPHNDIKLLFRAILQSGDCVFLKSFLDLVQSDRELSDILLEATKSSDETGFKTVITHPAIKRLLTLLGGPFEYLDRLLYQGLNDFPAHGLAWLFDFLPAAYLIPANHSVPEIRDQMEERRYHQSDMILQQVFIFGGSSRLHQELKTFWPKEGIELWIIPALFRHDREVFSLFLDKGLGRLQPLRLLVADETIGSEMYDRQKMKSRSAFPPIGMPDLPLYCAIFLAFEPEFILLLCERGASISGSTKPRQPQPVIIEHLDSLLTVHQARKSFQDASKHTGKIFWHKTSLGELKLDPFGSNELCFKIARDVARKYCPWFAHISGPGLNPHAISMSASGSPTEFDTDLDNPWIKAQMPHPLRTQEAWDKWRAEVLQILREHHVES